MHRIDSADRAIDLFGAGKDGFTDGDPGMGIPPTHLTDDFFNSLQEELCRLIESNGVVLSKPTLTQLLTVFRSPIGVGAAAAIAATGGSTSGSGLTGTGGAPNGLGVQGFGTGNGIGVEGSGSTPIATAATAGTGVVGRGGLTNGRGIEAFGKGAGHGIVATGGSGSNAFGVFGIGLSGNGGVRGDGQGAGAGIVGNGGSSGSGGTFLGGGTSAAGVFATGSTTSGPGIIATGGSTNGLGVQGFGTGTGCGVEGSGASSPIATAATTGSGVVGRGGQTNGFGGEFFGKGTGAGLKSTGGSGSGGTGIIGQGGSTQGFGGQFFGTGVTEGVSSVGGSTNGSSGITCTSAATNGNGLIGTGTGTGFGLEGVGVDGYGVVAQSDTTTPAKAALRVVPQDTDPGTSPASGDAYVNTVGGRPSMHNGQEWAGLATMVYQSVAAADTLTAVGQFASAYSIPANSLRVGSRIRVRAQGIVTSAGSGNSTVQINLGGSSTGVTTSSRANTANEAWNMDAVITIRTLGAGGSMSIHGSSQYGSTGAAGSIDSRMGAAVTTRNTTGALLVEISLSQQSGTATHRLDHLSVDIVD